MVIEVVLASPSGRVTIVLKSGAAKSMDAMSFDQAMPGIELFDGKPIARANILDADRATEHGMHDIRLAPRYPTGRVGRR